MRHVNSLLLSLALAPAIWVLTGYGLEQQDPQPVPVVPIAYLIAGVLFAVLVTARISPVGPALAGLVYLALAGWLAADPERVRQVLVGLYPAGDPMLLRPAEGLAALLGVPLVATVLRTRRWRHYRGMIALYAGADDADRTDQRPVSVSPEHPPAYGPDYPVQPAYPPAPPHWER
ncbi:hypothetical protein ACFQ0D_14735, partial [Micromonospora zhanjiangensis]